MFPAGYSWYEIYSFEPEAKVHLCTLLIFVLSVEVIGALELEEFWYSTIFLKKIHKGYEIFISPYYRIGWINTEKQSSGVLIWLSVSLSR